ncbi:hypothetical protein NLG97_g11245 [Lecanicillium saksenae]|uniref:Uncharacterized protein n=1 Tax=Lecanicillium saksenae TaxID=468837 RepID=A0ACC1QAY3_9HYPO|nr:hypothetical protein NLG97_g11245 [Lecanicillium saksenae]
MASMTHSACRIPSRVAYLCAECANRTTTLAVRSHSIRAFSELRAGPVQPDKESDSVEDAQRRASSSLQQQNAPCRSSRRASVATPRDTSTPRPESKRRGFHTYFVTHLPSSSMHPDARRITGGHKLPRDASMPHTPAPGAGPAIAIPNLSSQHLMTVRIPLRRAKHHFGSACSRGSRPYNEDTDQAGIVDIPAFAKRGPMSVKQKPGEPTPAESQSGDPQIFYFGVFDGHGGTQCSAFLRDELHGYIEEASRSFGLKSSLRKQKPGREGEGVLTKDKALKSVPVKKAEEVEEKVEDNENARMRQTPKHGKPLQSEYASPSMPTR